MLDPIYRWWCSGAHVHLAQSIHSHLAQEFSTPLNKRCVDSFNQCLSHGGVGGWEGGGEERPKASLLNLNTGLKIELARSQPLIHI